jgi:O-antigen/teichoic acid export membrane protein
VGAGVAMSEFGLGQVIVNRQNVAYANADYREVNRVLATSFGMYWLITIPIGILTTLVILDQPVEALLFKDATATLRPDIKLLLFLTATLGLLRVPGNVYPATLLGLRETGLRQIVESSLILLQVLATLLTLILGGKVLALLLVTNLGVILIQLTSYSLVRLRHAEVELRWKFWTPSMLWPLMSSSAYFFLYAVSLFAQRSAGNLLAGKFSGLSEVPALFVCLTLFRVVGWSLADIISQTAQPYIILLAAQGRRDRVEFFASLCAKLSFGTAVVYASLVLLAAEAVIRHWLGPGMVLGHASLGLLAGSFLIDAFFLATNNFMRGLNCQRGLSLAMGSYAMLSILFGIAGAKWWTTNPVLGLCAGQFAASLLGQALPLPWLTCRWLGIGWKAYVQEFLLRPILLGAALVLLAACAAAAGIREIWQQAALGMALTFTGGWLGWRYVLAAGDRDWLKIALTNFHTNLGRMRLPVIVQPENEEP